MTTRNEKIAIILHWILSGVLCMIIYTFNARLSAIELREKEVNERRVKIMTAIEMEILEALEMLDGEGSSL